MKKKVLLSLVLALALIAGTFTTVFAAGVGPATDATKADIVASGIQISQKIEKSDKGPGEVTAEWYAIRLHDTTLDGGYKLIDTTTLKEMNKKNVVIIDTMPEPWWSKRHIPGAICSEVGKKGPAFEFEGTQKADLYKAVKAAVGTKKYTYYWNGKKWTTKKPKTLKKCTKKKDKHYGKKSYTVRKINKDKTIVVYCGFVGCERSHQGAKYLVQKGFKNVYRYPAGISGWVDAGYDIEGSDVQ
jgi:rhodanese-related sulfurtransferase